MDHPVLIALKFGKAKKKKEKAEPKKEEKIEAGLSPKGKKAFEKSEEL